MDYHRCFAEISLGAIAHNIEEARRRIDAGVKLLAVVKADAYGHGAVRVAAYLEGLVDYFAVATLGEAVSLRKSGIQAPILILGYTSPSQFFELIEYGITQTIDTFEAAKALDLAAGRLGRKAKVHIALDTGMTRIGFQTSETDKIVCVAGLPNLTVEGMFTHFAKADETDKSFTSVQAERFAEATRTLQARGVTIPLCHIANSAGIMDFDTYRFNMVRSGIVTYGIYPSNEVNKERLDLRPALSWKTHIIHLKEVGAGVPVSYGGTFVTTRPQTRIATLSVGYADGYPRALSGKGRVLIHGCFAPILGRVCMDQMMVDVTDIPEVALEDIATLVGADGKERISIEEVADPAGSFNYEMLCHIGPRVERLYVE